MDFDLSGLEIPANIHQNGTGLVKQKGSKPIPKFHWVAEINKFETERTGIPVTTNKLWCEQHVVGQRDQPGWVEVKFITNQHGKKIPDPTNIMVKRYPQELKRFLELGEAPPEGLPLEQWPRMTRDLVAICHYLEIRTVEQLASIDNELTIQKLGMGGRELVAQAKAFLGSQRDELYAEQLAAEKEELQRTITMLQQSHAELLARLEEVSGKKRKGE